MNLGRFAAAVVAVWVVRSVLNFLFYGVAMASYYEALMTQHPEVFREVIPGFIATDLLFAAFFVFLWAKTGSAFGSGRGAGVKFGAWIGLFFGLVWNLYYFFGFTFMTLGDVALDTAYSTVAVALQGAVAASVYRPAEAAGPAL
jgi:hypothetical protein